MGLLRVIGEWSLGEVRRDLVAMFASDVPTHGIIPRKSTRAVRARHSDTLMPLPDVGAQIRLISVKSLAVWTLQFFTWNSYTSKIEYFIQTSFHEKFRKVWKQVDTNFNRNIVLTYFSTTEDIFHLYKQNLIVYALSLWLFVFYLYLMFHG